MLLAKNILAAGWSRGSGAIIRLLQVPLLLHALGAEDYGRWLLLTSIPAWLSLTNVGLGSVTSNALSAAVARGEFRQATRLYSTTAAALLAIAGFGITICALAIPHLPWTLLLKTSTDAGDDIRVAALVLACSTFLSFFEELFGGRIRAARRAHQSMLLSSTRPWAELGAICLVLTVSHSFRDLALAQLTATTLYLSVYWAFSRSAMPAIRFNRAAVNYMTFKEMAPAAAAFQALPLSNALVFQGSLMAVQAALGPTAVAIFATIRTVIRTVSQIIEAMNQAVWPELSHSIAAQDQPRSRYLHRLAVNSSVFASTIGAAAMVFAGPTLYSFWLGKELLVPDHVFFAFCLLLPINSIWVASSVVQMASNQHMGFAVRYLGYAIVSVAVCYPLTVFFGLVGTALSGALMDMCLLKYVMRKSLRITNDNLLSMVKSTPELVKKFMLNFAKILRRS